MPKALCCVVAFVEGVSGQVSSGVVEGRCVGKGGIVGKDDDASVCGVGCVE